MALSRSTTAIVRVWITRQSFRNLVLSWALIYFGTGLLFASLYWSTWPSFVTPASPAVRSFPDCAYFSFTTLSTLGYGDLTPVGIGRVLSIAEAFLGISLNAIVLGIVVFKALRRSIPIAFSDAVYDQASRQFRLRFVNTDEDNLRNVTISCSSIKKLTLAEADGIGAQYDTITTSTPIELSTWAIVPPFRVMALKTLPHAEHIEIKPLVSQDHFPNEIPSPELFYRDMHRARSFETHFEISGSGYYESTGEQFFFRKQFAAHAIRCGAFVRVSNNDLELIPRARERVAHMNNNFNQVNTTPEDTCRSCNFFPNCQFPQAILLRCAATR